MISQLVLVPFHVGVTVSNLSTKYKLQLGSGPCPIDANIDINMI